ncbi:6686_t:CDS:2, partial [Funneliformis caledonium]
FQIKKCGKPECVFCNPVLLPPDIFKEVYWIPDPQKSSDSDHFQNFDSIYGYNTTEQDRPNKQSKKDKKEYASQGMLVSGRIRDFVWCKSCKKPRYVFSKN